MHTHGRNPRNSSRCVCARMHRASDAHGVTLELSRRRDPTARKTARAGAPGSAVIPLTCRRRFSPCVSLRPTVTSSAVPPGLYLSPGHTCPVHRKTVFHLYLSPPPSLSVPQRRSPRRVPSLSESIRAAPRLWCAPPRNSHGWLLPASTGDLRASRGTILARIRALGSRAPARRPS